MRNLTPEYLLYAIPAIIIGMTIHEFCHGYVSYKMGDDTPLEQGRLSLNPLQHMDPWGFLSLLLFGFGWAKPVQVNPYSYRDSKSGMMWTALAGPISNFVLAFLCVFLYMAVIKFGSYGNNISNILLQFFSMCASINLGMGIFNLIPVPPLDGSKILLGVLNKTMYFKILEYERVLSIGLMVLLFSGLLNGPLFHARTIFMDVFSNISMLILGL